MRSATGSDAEASGRFGFLRRTYAMMVKEFIQLRRDRVSFGMIIMLPVMQLLLFGYAINTTPRHLPTAVLLQEDSDLGRSILKAMENTAYFRFTRQVSTRRGVRRSAAVGQGAVRRRNPARLRTRGASRRSAQRFSSPPTRPIPSLPAPALGALGTLVQTALAHDLYTGDPPSPPFEIRAHARYNPGRRRRGSISCPGWSAPS